MQCRSKFFACLGKRSAGFIKFLPVRGCSMSDKNTYIKILSKGVYRFFSAPIAPHKTHPLSYQHAALSHLPYISPYNSPPANLSGKEWLSSPKLLLVGGVGLRPTTQQHRPYRGDLPPHRVLDQCHGVPAIAAPGGCGVGRYRACTLLLSGRPSKWRPRRRRYRLASRATSARRPPETTGSQTEPASTVRQETP